MPTVPFMVVPVIVLEPVIALVTASVPVKFADEDIVWLFIRPEVIAPVTPSVPPMVALFVTANPVPAAVKLIAVEVVAPLPVTVAKVSASAVRYDPDAW